MNNARDACIPSGGVITIITHHERQKVIISIKDTGTGIMTEKTDLIFQPFFTTKSDGKGTGLGLSVCNEILENHKGEIHVESQAGAGSTFTIKLHVDGNFSPE